MADELFDKCLEKLKLRIGALAVNAESVVTVVKYAMEIVELTKVKGRGQRDLAVKLIRRVVVDAPIDHVDTLGPLRRLHTDTIIVHEEVRPA